MSLRAVLLVVVVAVLAGLLIYSQKRTEPLKVSGFIEADEIRLGSRVGGRVLKVHVEEGQIVATGEVLVELEPFDLQERLAQARAEVASHRAALSKLKTGLRDEEKAQVRARLDQFLALVSKLEEGPRAQEITAARAQLKLAKSQVERAQQLSKRMKSLYERNSATLEEVERADTELTVSLQTAEVREAELSLLLEGTRTQDLDQAKAQAEEARQAHLLAQKGYRDEEIAEAAAALEAAEAAVRVIESQLQELVIKAPVAGAIEAIELQPGDLIGPNAPAIALSDSARLWVRAYVPENHPIQLNTQLEVTVDGFPNRTFRGVVTFVARSAEFTPSNVQTPEERAKQVFRIKVDLQEGLDLLRPGMPVDVWLESGSGKSAAPDGGPRPPATSQGGA